MNSSDMSPEFRDLVARLCEGDLTPQETLRLEEIAKDDANALQYYLQYLDLHGTLRRYSAADEKVSVPGHEIDVVKLSGVSRSPFQVEQKSKMPISLGGSNLPSRWPMITGWALFSVALAFIAIQFFKPAAERPLVNVAAPLSPHSNNLGVAFLTADNGVTWGGGRLITRNVGSSVPLGDEIALNEGIAEFRLSNGVYVSIEGPASMVLVSPSVLVLQYGKLTANVPWTVTDFKAIAASCRLTACGAEFGLTQDGNKIEVHTFSGEVRAESPQVLRETDAGEISDGGSVVVDDAGVFTKATITAGNALSLVADGDALKLQSVGGKAASEKFATKLPMAGALPVPRSYVDAVLKSKPIGYWRFESTKGGVVKNEAAGGSDLKLVGNVRLAGRVGNSSVEFRPKSESHLISEPLNELAGSDYTLEAWVKPSHFHLGSILSLFNTQPEHATLLELQSATRGVATKAHCKTIRFVHFNMRNNRFINNRTCYSKKPYDIRRWQHIVAVKEGSQMRLYVNGVLSSTDSTLTPLASKLHEHTHTHPNPHVLLGWIPVTPDRSFVGQLDEVSVYARALNEKEIMRHYEIVKDVIDSQPGEQSADTSGSLSTTIPIPVYTSPMQFQKKVAPFNSGA